jgi:catechol 2,3-dioxygenase-like lactoylglutathione lyase family enzyme
MIDGAHIVIFTADPEADRAFFRDVLGFSNIDVGGGWLIFAMPPAEVGFHPAEESGMHKFYLMCADIEAEIARLRARGVVCDPVIEEQWGRLSQMLLPGGGKLPFYQPKHVRAHS